MKAAAVHSSLVLPGSGVPLPKCPSGRTSTQHHRRNARVAKRMMQLHKTEAKILFDFHCQRPGCTYRSLDVHGAHIDSAGFGGRDSLGWHEYVPTCPDDHVGARSLHSGHLLLVPRTDRGSDGPIDWYARETLDSPSRFIGTSLPPPGAPRGTY